MDRLNDLTSVEIDAIRERLDRKPRACPYCHRTFTPHRGGQVFCTAAHQKAWHKERVPMLEAQNIRLEEQLEHERAQWRAEREELIREIAALRDARKDA